MAFEISYHIITVALISFRPRDVFAVAPVSKYHLRLAGASLLQIMTDLRERRAAGDRRCGNQCSCREAPKPLDAHRRPFLRYRLRAEVVRSASGRCFAAQRG